MDSKSFRNNGNSIDLKVSWQKKQEHIISHTITKKITGFFELQSGTVSTQKVMFRSFQIIEKCNIIDSKEYVTFIDKNSFSDAIS